MKSKKRPQRPSVFGLSRPILFALAFVYLTYHTLHGERGLYAWIKQAHSHEVLSAELQKIRSEREELEKKVSHLRNDNLDLDLLDEQARRMLGLTGGGEKLIILR